MTELDRADLAAPGPRMVALPPALEQAIAAELARTPKSHWLAAAQALSERYRADRSATGQALASGSLDALAYAALIMPAAYAQLAGAIAATRARVPDFAPGTILDIGAGPGTALWAVADAWPSITTCVAWEREPAFIDLGQRLARTSVRLNSTRWQRVNLREAPWSREQRYDLVIIGHVLNELPEALQREVIDRAWNLTAGMLLIVEPGTSAAFPNVRMARDQVLALGAHTIAPCAHDLPCPLVHEWCHFPQRLKRPPFQREARGAPSEWEDSKFAYAGMARFVAPAPVWGRVIREPISNKAYAEVTVSTAAGVQRFQAFKRYKPVFRMLKDVAWGAALTEPLPEPIVVAGMVDAEYVNHGDTENTEKKRSVIRANAEP